MSATTVPFNISELVTERPDLFGSTMAAGVAAFAMIPIPGTPVGIANAIMAAASGLIENHSDGTRALVLLAERLGYPEIDTVTTILQSLRPLNGLRYVVDDGQSYLMMK